MLDTRIPPQGGSGTAPPKARRVVDNELKAMNDVAKLMSELKDDAEKTRVLNFILGRYAPENFTWGG